MKIGCGIWDIKSILVVDIGNHLIDIATTTGLVKYNTKDGSPINKIITEKVLIMFKHKVRHLVVTHEKEVVGIISSFDLLRFVEEKRFVAK